MAKYLHRRDVVKMAALEIVQIGHPALRCVTREVATDEIDSPAMQQLVDEMVVAMHEAKGVGLAAPQVDVNVRLFVAEAHPSERRPDITDLELLVMFNPRIAVVDATLVSDWEGCLSIDRGAMMGMVKRAHRIRLEGIDRMGQATAVELEGFHARIAQHEADHLEGILFLDRIYERLSPREEPVIATRDNYDRFFAKRIEATSEPPQ